MGAPLQKKQDVIVSIIQRVSNGNRTIDVLETGGRVTVTLAPSGEVLATARTWEGTVKTYYIAFWNVENLFDTEDSAERPGWLQKNLLKS